MMADEEDADEDEPEEPVDAAEVDNDLVATGGDLRSPTIAIHVHTGEREMGGVNVYRG